MSYVSRKYALSVCQRYERSHAFVQPDTPLASGVPYNRSLLSRFFITQGIND